MRELHVAVTGLSATDNPAPGVAVIRSLREQPGWCGRIIGLAYDAYEPGIFDPRLVDAVYLLPYPSAGKEAVLQRLDEILQRERIDVLLPTLDSELSSFSQAAQQLAARGIRTFLPTEDQLKRRSKANLAALAKDLGLRVPESAAVTDFRSAEKAADEIGFPLMVKGLFYEAYRAANSSELFAAMQALVTRWGYPVILQEYVPGEEYNLAGLGDGKGGIVSAVCMKKVSVTDRGKGWAGVSIVNEQLTDVARAFVKALQWRGGFELEMLMSDKEELNLIEINPRFPAWIYLTTACGINLPYAYCLLASGEQPRMPQEYEPGILFVRCTTDLIARVKQIEDLLTRREIHY